LEQQSGGAVGSGGGLIFAATNDKKLRAYDQDTGKVVWEFNLPSAAEGVPAVYEEDGREYIAICAAGGNGPTMTLHGVTPAAEGQPAAGAYIAFVLPKR